MGRGGLRLEDSTMTDMGIETHSISKFSLHQKLREDLDIAVELNHDSKDKKFGMVFGGKLSKYKKVLCRAKVDDSFSINTSFEMELLENVKLTLSNTVRLTHY